MSAKSELRKPLEKNNNNSTFPHRSKAADRATRYGMETRPRPLIEAPSDSTFENRERKGFLQWINAQKSLTLSERESEIQTRS